MMDNPKSDVRAKQAFRDELLRRQFDSAEVTSTPADVTATKAGQTYYYEVKYTAKEDRYFGAATLTEWEAARDPNDHFTFVVAFRRNDKWVFHEYTPDEFMQFSNIPPFKIYFNVGVAEERDTNPPGDSNSVGFTWARLQAMSELFRQFRSGSI